MVTSVGAGAEERQGLGSGGGVEGWGGGEESWGRGGGGGGRRHRIIETAQGQYILKPPNKICVP